jgi:hypothetical protein
LDGPVTTSEAEQSRRNASGRLALGAAVLCSLVGIALVLVATSRGVGVSPDSVYFVGAARNVLDGRGLSQFPDAQGRCMPMVHWPPLYPLALAAISATGLDVLVAARWLSAGLFGATILLLGLMIRRLGAPNWLVFAATLCAAAATDMVKVHAMAWSEPPCIFFGMLGFLLLDLHIERPRRLLLIAAAAALAFAFLARYAGSAYVVVGALVLLTVRKRRLSARLADLALFAAVAGILMAAALVRNVSIGGSATARTIAFDPMKIQGELPGGLNTVAVWFLPQFVGPTLRAVLLGVLVVGAVGWAVRLRRQAGAPGPAQAAWPASALPVMLAAFIVCYLVLMLVSIAVISPMPILDYRNLAPVFPVAVVLASWMVVQVMRSARSARRARFVRVASVIVCCVFVAVYSVRAVKLVATLKRTGGDLRRDEWVHSEVAQHVRDLAADRPIYSNSPTAVYFLTGRGASLVPLARASQAQLAAFRTRLKETRSVVVYFQEERRQGLMAPADLAERLHLEVLVQASDGVIYETARE